MQIPARYRKIHTANTLKEFQGLATEHLMQIVQFATSHNLKEIKEHMHPYVMYISYHNDP